MIEKLDKTLRTVSENKEKNTNIHTQGEKQQTMSARVWGLEPLKYNQAK